ncbi:MAG: hypothetical protein ACI8PZ_005256 [Myxococcota bacterium]|jgi:hypothetical protein
MLTRSLLLCAFVLSSGCYAVKVKQLQPAAAPAGSDKMMVHTLIYGLVSLNDVDAGESCGDAGVAMVQSKMNGITFLANFFTAGIYAPMAVEITCAQRR